MLVCFFLVCLPPRQGSEGGEEVDLLQRTQPMLAGKVSMLPKDVIEICREKDINFSKRPDVRNKYFCSQHCQFNLFSLR